MANQTNDHSAMRPSSLRRANAALVLDRLADGAAVSRSELAELTSLSSQALGAILGELVGSGLVIEQLRETTSPGRPPTEYRLNEIGSFTVSVLVRIADYFVLIDDALGQRIATERRRYRSTTEAGPVLAVIGETVTQVMGRLGLEPARLAAVEFATLGHVHEDHRRVVDTRAWQEDDVDVAERLAAILSTSARISVTSNELAQAAHALGAVRPGDFELVAVIHLGLEQRLFLAQGERLLTNRASDNGSLSHVPVGGNEQTCDCGEVGCLATVSGSGAILRDYERRTGRRLDAAADVIDRVQVGDEDAIEVLRTSSEWLGRGIAPILQLHRPDRVVLAGGGVGRADSSGAKRLTEAIRKHLDGLDAPVHIVPPAFVAGATPIDRDEHRYPRP